MWRRAAAFLLDLVPLLVLALIENQLGIADHPVVAGLNLLFLLAYFAGMNYQFGGTIGKRMMGLRVALPATPNAAMQLLIRAVVKLLLMSPPAATVYALVAIWRDDGRSIADFASNSTVVDEVTLKPPQPLTSLGRWSASVLALIAPWVLLLVLGIYLFGLLLFRELLKELL